MLDTLALVKNLHHFYRVEEQTALARVHQARATGHDAAHAWDAWVRMGDPSVRVLALLREAGLLD